MDLITIVCDRNPYIDNAIDTLAPYIKAGDVTSLRPADAMGQSLECSVRHVQRANVVAALTRDGFRIVEGGQQ